MTLNQLVCRAASVYPDAYILQYWDTDRQESKADPHGGDTLAHFIVCELHETFVPDVPEGEQIATAVLAMQQAADKLADVAHAISNLHRELLAA